MSVEQSHEWSEAMMNNERLRELEQQSVVYTDEDGWDFDRWKFAELIVRECSTLAYDGPNGILEHFGLGVEE